jgi:hypothetical protein
MMKPWSSFSRYATCCLVRLFGCGGLSFFFFFPVLGENKKELDVARALELAKSCSHNEARWLCDVLDEKTNTIESAHEQFTNLAERDPRALCYAFYYLGIGRRNIPLDEIERLANAGVSLAQVKQRAVSIVSSGLVFRW